MNIFFLVIGIASILIAGYEDKKNRLAPAIYASPLLIGFALNPMLGLIGAVGTFIIYKAWQEKWDKYFGMADLILLFTLIIALFNPFTFVASVFVCILMLIDIKFFQKEKELPLIWIAAKWIFVLTIGIILGVAYLGQ